MDFSHIEKLIELLKKHEVGEIEVEVGGTKVRVVAKTKMISPRYFREPSVSTSGSFSTPERTSVGGPTPPPPSGTEVLGARQVMIKSPFVGTYYESPAPGAETFVQIGKTIRKGDPLCIIEAMKLMNELESEFECKIVKILAANGQAVEFDQPLFVVEKL